MVGGGGGVVGGGVGVVGVSHPYALLSFKISRGEKEGDLPKLVLPLRARIVTRPPPKLKYNSITY